MLNKLLIKLGLKEDPKKILAKLVAEAEKFAQETEVKVIPKKKAPAKKAPAKKAAKKAK